jgi:hypothetical protein
MRSLVKKKMFSSETNGSAALGAEPLYYSAVEVD